jgi:DNA-binding ferritin-like protein
MKKSVLEAPFVKSFSVSSTAYDEECAETSVQAAESDEVLATSETFMHGVGMLSELWTTLLADLQALYAAHQSAHWRSSGDSFYGDHQMYQRMYEDIREEIDDVVEKMLGTTGDDALVEPTRMLVAATTAMKTLVHAGDAASSLLIAEKTFLKQLCSIIEAMDSIGKLTDGTDNLLQGIADKHEEHVYLLSRRVGIETLKVCVGEALEKDSDVFKQTTAGPKLTFAKAGGKSEKEREMMLASRLDKPSDLDKSMDIYSDIEKMKKHIAKKHASRAQQQEGKKRKKKRAVKTWDIGGPISTGPDNPGFNSSAGPGNAE